TCSHHGIHVAAIGSRIAPGPGRPATVSTSGEPDDASQKVPTTVTFPVFGNVGSGNVGVGGAALPVRTTGSGKHGVEVLPVQQFWLMPPFTSMHAPVGLIPTHAVPVQEVPQDPHPLGRLCVCPGQGGEPGRVDIAVVSGNPMGMLPAGVPEG